MNAVDASWAKAVGYRHEVLHTGLLAALLKFGEDERGPVRKAVASLLLEGAVGARSAVPEGRADGARRKCDLLVQALNDDEVFEVAVETKVDSDWTTGQLEGEMGSSAGSTVVLLALGVTALVPNDADLKHADERFRVVGPAALAEAIGSIAGDLPAWTADYLDALKLETSANEEARASARNATHGMSNDWRDVKALRDHWGYFGEVLNNLGDRARWERKTRVSGPLVTRWNWWAGNCDGVDEDAGAYLEFVGLGDGDRRLAIKAWSQTNLSGLQTELWRASVPLLSQQGRRVGNSRKTCTVGYSKLGSPIEAAALANRLLVEFHPEAAFEKALAAS